MGNISTRTSSQRLVEALKVIPDEFRSKLVEKYLELRRALLEGRSDTASMRAAYFAETLLRYLQHRMLGTFTPFGKKIPDFTIECQKLERAPSTTGDEGIRVIMPRALNFVYTLRNKRGVGHVGGDVDSNAIDSATAARVADWCMCELIRVCRALSLEDAQAILDALTVRQLPQVWVVGGKKRILRNSLDYRSQVLVLLHSEIEAGIPLEDLQDWVEHSHRSYFKRDVIRPLHESRLIEFDETSQVAVISPSGIKRVEEVILPKIQQGEGGGR